jgi:hypothetical protein
MNADPAGELAQESKGPGKVSDKEVQLHQDGPTQSLKRNIGGLAIIGLGMSSEWDRAWPRDITATWPQAITLAVLGVVAESVSTDTVRPVCNGWAAMSSTIVIGLAQGGTAVVLYGLIFTSAINVCLALTLGEMAAAYPSAGGQYVWSSILAGPRTKRAMSFVVGWTTIFSWITIVSGAVPVEPGLVRRIDLP